MADKTVKRKYFLFFIIGGITAVIFIAFSNKTIEYTSTNEFCASCHAHPHSDVTWKLSAHNSNRTGVPANCVDCHLPPEDQTLYFLTRKAYHGFHDLYVYVTTDMEEIDWASKRTVEASKRFVYEDGCKKCHTNLFPSTLNSLGAESHLKYMRDPENNSCVQCHLTVGHYRGETEFSLEEMIVSSTEIFDEPAHVDSFKNYTEQIPGTTVSFNMNAIPGGIFKIGSSSEEPYHRPDESPVREVKIDSFWMAEIEVSWNEYLAFFNATSSQGRKEAVIEVADEETDGISGATPPWGAPDQGWGMSSRPAITMTHHAAETYCRWLSSVTGKKYRLPTEAEWEYAARAGTTGPYFFEGSPKDFENDGLWNKIFGPDTSVINSYVIYQENSPFRTQPPELVKANPFGLKNMLGNVAEFCSDYYDPQIYSKYPQGMIVNPRGPRQGLEHVIRGGSFKNTAKDLRIARRDFTRTKEWLETDPQIPKSIWWYSDANHVGFRVICEFDPNEFDSEITKN